MGSESSASCCELDVACLPQGPPGCRWCGLGRSLPVAGLTGPLGCCRSPVLTQGHFLTSSMDTSSSSCSCSWLLLGCGGLGSWKGSVTTGSSVLPGCVAAETVNWITPLPGLAPGAGSDADRYTSCVSSSISQPVPCWVWGAVSPSDMHSCPLATSGLSGLAQGSRHTLCWVLFRYS